MLGSSYPFVVVGAFVVALAAIAYFSGGGIRFFIAVMACFVSISTLFIVPHLIAPLFDKLPRNARHVISAVVLGLLAVAMVRGLYRKYILGKPNEDSEPGQRE